MIDATSFETEETLKIEEFSKYGMSSVNAPFFDPSGGTLYAGLAGTLYEWDLRINEASPEWWIGE